MNLSMNGIIRIFVFIGLILAMVFTVHAPGAEKLTTESSQEINAKDKKRSVARLTTSIKVKRFVINMSVISVLMLVFSSFNLIMSTSQRQHYPTFKCLKHRLLRPIKFTSQYL